MKRNVVVFAVMVVLLAGLLLMARSRQKHGAGAAGPERVAVGQPAPEFTLKDMQGKPVALSSFRGKAVVLNFWATWCPPCKEETPWLVDAQKRYAAQGLQIVGVSMDDSGDQKQVAKFMEETAINYPILLGKEDVAQKYGGIEGLPTTFYIDRNGVVSEQVLGQRERSEIEQSIQKLLAVR